MSDIKETKNNNIGGVTILYQGVDLDLIDSGYDDQDIEIYWLYDEASLVTLRDLLAHKMAEHTEATYEEAQKYIGEEVIQTIRENTKDGNYNHEVLIEWSPDWRVVWVIGNGSAEDYGNYHKQRYTELIMKGIDEVKKEAKEVRKIVSCEHCGFFNFDYESCTCPAPDKNYACPLYEDEGR